MLVRAFLAGDPGDHRARVHAGSAAGATGGSPASLLRVRVPYAAALVEVEQRGQTEEGEADHALISLFQETGRLGCCSCSIA